MINFPEGLHPSTVELVEGFTTALAEKLRRSEIKYGWSDGWKDADWQEKCLEDFNHHIVKGDPRDVAAYCAFMWFHGWQTKRLNATAQPVSDGWASLLTDRQRSIINFALHRFMNDAYSNASIVAQDKRLDSSMADTFTADAKDAEALMSDIGRHRDKLAASPGGKDI